MLKLLAATAGALLLIGSVGDAQTVGDQTAPVPGPQIAQSRGIEIYNADYGERGRYCNAERRISRECNGRRDCEIEVDNRLCGDPATGVVKELRLNFGCEGRRSQGQDAVRAREGQRVRLSCERGRANAQVFGRPAPGPEFGQRPGDGRDIRVLSARYGSRRGACNAAPAVAQKCNGRDRCRIEADNSLCGDPAYGEQKQLEITYACGRGQRNAVGREGARIELHC
jgi:hypothetical protein